jgi:hypothetical protein
MVATTIDTVRLTGDMTEPPFTHACSDHQHDKAAAGRDFGSD